MEAVIGIDVQVESQEDLDYLCETLARAMCPLTPPHEVCLREFSFAARLKTEDELLENQGDPAMD